MPCLRGARAVRIMIEAKPIIHGEEWKELVRCFTAKRWVVATGGERRRFRALLSGWEIDAICRFVPLPDTSAIRMHFHGIPVSGPAYRDSTGRVAHAAVRDSSRPARRSALHAWSTTPMPCCA